MKRLLCCGALLLLAGCGQTQRLEPATPAPASPAPSMTPAPQPTAEPTALPAPTETTPVDLTSLSSTMVYAEVFHMVSAPQDYVGRTVTAQGTFAVYDANPDPEINGGVEHYFAVVVADATACCQQGLEFVLGGGAQYPQDYPEPGSEICVRGTFALYEWNGTQYGHLVEAEWSDPS